MKQTFARQNEVHSVYMTVTCPKMSVQETINYNGKVYLLYSCSMAILPSVPSNFLSKHILALTEASSLTWKNRHRIHKANQELTAKEDSSVPQDT